MLHVICTYVSVYMMHSYERFARRQRICFCSGDPYEERPHKSRTVGHTYHIHWSIKITTNIATMAKSRPSVLKVM